MTQNFTGQIKIGTEKYSYDLVFGYDNNSDSLLYDKEKDKYAPPTPPMNFFDAALGLNGERYYSKIIGTPDEEVIFAIYLQMGDNKKINISWDNSKWEDKLEYCNLEDAYGGKLDIKEDMLKKNNIEITNGLINVLRIKFKKK